MITTKKLAALGLLATATGTVAFAIAQQPPPPRMHRVTDKGTLHIRPADSTPEFNNEVTIEIVGDQRVIKANGIPNHKTGMFPNAGNPNRIAPKASTYSIPAKPEIADNATPMRGMFGVAINGVPFDPGAAEFYAGEPGWQYEPLSGAIDLGIDVSHAHVQPNGKYHYHGLPTGLLDAVQLEPGKHSPLIGWAADGFPMYAVYGYSDPKDPSSKIQKVSSSYQLKQGNRPGGNAPDGKYDGTFVRDYEFVAGAGDLDECCGRFTVTPEFPEGTYAYFMTETWPVVPRMYRGTPSADFIHGPGAGGPGRGGTSSGRGLGLQGDRQGPRSAQDPRGMGRPDGQLPPRPGQVLPEFVRQRLNLSEEQQKKLTGLQEKVDEQLKEILTPEQIEQLSSPPTFPGRR